MKNLRNILGSVVAIAVFGFVASAQEGTSKPTQMTEQEQNAPVELAKGDKITRGEALAKGVDKAKVEKALANPAKFADKTVEVSGVIVRSCKSKGCWMEMADKDGGKSVRVTFGEHAFFIPLNSAGMKVRAQGVFRTRTLSKETVDHLINDDGAKFESRNADGTVTEISFDATGVVLTKAS